MNGQTLTKAMVPLPGKAFAIYNNSTGPLYYAHPDLLGSIRLATTPARAKYFDTAYAPFGETYASSGTLDAAYTGQMDDTAQRQDTVGGLYDFPAREYSTQGRWPSPDPAGVAATCTKDPQSQNRYAYVRNNPITRVDPNGMSDIDYFPDIDPFCDPCFLDPLFCGGGGGGFVGGGGGGGTPKPRTFPWPLLPPGFFGDQSAKKTCKETISNKQQAMQGDECDHQGGVIVETWSCEGDINCCWDKLDQYRDKCKKMGKGYFVALGQPFFGSFYPAECCRPKGKR
ncbi:MAG TPA: RHS repeat-associated core domain-containing protein [Candidatus Acidoferrum sp.]|jgi:RHS repeat-associated protein